MKQRIQELELLILIVMQELVQQLTRQVPRLLQMRVPIALL